MPDTAPLAQRPLSPHLQVYRWTITMAMSIAHRVTGAALYAGSLLFAWLLIAAASGPKPYARASHVFGSVPGRIVMFGFTWALMLHLLGGVRHLIWDTGAGMGPGDRETIAWISLIGSVLLALVIWVVVFVIG